MEALVEMLRKRAHARQNFANAILGAIVAVMAGAGVLLWRAGDIARTEIDVAPLRDAVTKILALAERSASAAPKMPAAEPLPAVSMPPPPVMPQLPPSGSELPARLPFRFGETPAELKKAYAYLEKIGAEQRQAKREILARQKQAQQEITLRQAKAQAEIESRQMDAINQQRQLATAAKSAEEASRSLQGIVEKRSVLPTAITAGSIRAVVVVLTLFLVQLLAGLVRFNSLLAAHYDARADALLLLEPGNLDAVERMSKAMSPDSAIGFGRSPKTPQAEMVELLRLVLEAAGKART